jgi:hypothetical protein
MSLNSIKIYLKSKTLTNNSTHKITFAFTSNPIELPLIALDSYELIKQSQGKKRKRIKTTAL